MDLTQKRSIYTCSHSEIQGYIVNANEIIVEQGKIINITGGTIYSKDNETSLNTPSTKRAAITWGAQKQGDVYVLKAEFWSSDVDLQGIITSFISQVETLLA